jgi:hypothetical protein
MTKRRVAVVPHTHWDREWYEPFQTFRLRLVDLLDELIPLLETDPSYARYLLDGQMAVIDDYLEVRPEMEERLRRLAASGRVSVGPWYILVDEFLVSAETIIRDLQLGIERGAAFGGVTSVGYLPDMFGHIAQMPQILRQAGFNDTVLWRGVPSAITQSGFNWVGPDGSQVRAEYLMTGYGNGSSLPNDAKALVTRVNAHLDEVGSFLLKDLLLMNGSDHLMPQRHLGRVVAEANELQDDLEFSITSLAEYLSNAPREGLQSWHGELRSGYRSNILMGVLSNRVDVKLLASQTERAIERRAEPYGALLADPASYPDSLLRLAWREIIRNAAHDSICACSVDETVDAVLHRFQEARQIANGLAQRSLDAFARSLAERGVVVVNPTSRVRSGLVEAIVAGEEFNDATMQLIEQRGALPDSMVLDAESMRSILSVIQGNRIDDNAWVHAAELTDHGDELALDVTIGTYEVAGVDLAESRQVLLALLAARPELQTRVTLSQPTIRRVVGLVRDVAGYGWAPFAPVAPQNPVSAPSSTEITNGLASLVVDESTGTFALNGVAGFGRLVDVGDLGDSYNYSPPLQDSCVDRPESVNVEILESGPLRARVAIKSRYAWPERIDEFSQQRVGSVGVDVRTVLELRADDPVVRVETTFVNPARDHRLRVHLPLAHGAKTSRAECIFTVVERELTAEGRSEEFGLPTFPSRRFVQAGGLSVAHEGLHEFELVDIRDGEAHELALTLVRSTGMLSRLGMAYRPLPAGPLTPVDGLQMVGSAIVSRYALCVGEIDPYAMADDFLVPFDAVGAPGGGTRASVGCSLDVRGAQVSMVRRVEGVLEVRVFNPTSRDVVVEVPGQRGWLVDLRGRGESMFEGSFELRAEGFATFRITDAP